MPTSPYGHLETYAVYLSESRPASILDIGLGNGKLGFIARDVLDVTLNERYRKQEWNVRIDGIEVFADYIQDHQRAIYNNIFIGDAHDVLDGLGTYDMITLGDVLEHFPKERAFAFLDKCIAHAAKNLLVFIPLGKTWKQPAIYGNPYETHRSIWYFDELKPFSSRYALFNYSSGPYGAFLIEKEKYVDFKVEQLIGTGRTPANGHPTLRERFNLSQDSISRIDLGVLSRHIVNPQHLRCFTDTVFLEHYRLIAHLSTCFSDSLIFDIGTNTGDSALALSFNPSNKLVSYDIVNRRELHFPEKLDRIEFRVGEVLDDPRLLSSPLIMLDTYHDGSFERKFYQFLKERRYKGLLFLDDIHLNPAMISFWDDITEPKEDITDLGHFSGSGLVEFN